MSDTAIFELETNVEREIIQEKLTYLWQKACKGYKVDTWDGDSYGVKTIFCELLYVFREPGEEEAIREVVDYLLSISLYNQIYYYRCDEYISEELKARSLTNITVDDLFTEQYRPSIGANIPQRFLIEG
ncbi:conserved hypothetical protein [Hyella patelloides LEGE 07179]|uniref:Uncharacterized protein n=1 Tax=Hyella patelloides LEGE 07179 TaxID=945734 RepID=A0A563W1W8_9CYAN|nr:hypothetical protein [Hyella patelloides]VEP17660.1 conserved hypothetical protein [Hyella patelloides LEGE 07179]